MARVMTCLLGGVLLLGMPLLAAAQDPGNAKKSQAKKVAADVEAWVKTLAGKIADRHDLIRQSARLGILAIGRDALPTLREVAKGNDNAAAYAAKQLIERIKRRGARPRAGFAGRRGRRGARGFGRGWGFGRGRGFGRGGRAGGGGRGSSGGRAPRPGTGSGRGPAGHRPGGLPPGPAGFGGAVGFGGAGVGGFGGAFAGGRRGGFGGPGVAPLMPSVAGALSGLDLSDKQKDQLKILPDKIRADLLKEMKSILNDEQYKKFEAAWKRTSLPPLRLTAPGSRTRNRGSNRNSD